MNASKYLQLSLVTLCLPLLFNQAHALQVDICQLDINRLPRQVLPEHYALNLNFSNSYGRTFDGEVNIDVSLNFHPEPKRSAFLFDCVKNCDSLPIILHAGPELEIHNVSFTEAGYARNKKIKVRAICRDPIKDLVRVELATKHKSRQTKGRLSFSFSGPILKKPEGVFDASLDSTLITTHFQPANARKAFPCFDEPHFKATFKVSLEVSSELTALSNMEPDNADEGELVGFKRVRFHRTPKMSTHLLAFAVGMFDRIDEESKGMKLVMWTPPGRALSALPQLQTAVSAYEELQDYFQIEQPLKKIDFVATYDQRGAMGSWGMIAFDSTLMADRYNLSPGDSYRVPFSVARELARGWFGSLVTMKWWDDLWLIEGFVRWISRVVMSKVRPDDDQQKIYLLNTMMKTLHVDSSGSRIKPLKKSQPQTVEQIQASLDAQIYEKAECVLNMLVNYIGALEFQQEIRNYISRNLYGNAGADDLWSALGRVSGTNVTRFMHSWLYESGYPIIAVRLSGANKPYMLKMKQGRFRGHKHPIWIIPMNFLISRGGSSELTTQKFVLSVRKDSVELPSWFDPAKHWLKLNANFQGFYRVVYKDQLLLDALGRAVKSKGMPPADRLNLIDEIQAQFNARFIPEKQLKEMIGWFRDEDDDGVISGLVEALKTLNKIREQKEDLGADALLRYYIETGRVRANPEDSYLRAEVRAKVLDYLVQEKRCASVIKDCYRLYKSFKGSGQRIPSSLSGAIYASVAAVGTDAEVKRVLELIGNIECERRRVTAATSVWNILQRGERKERFTRFSRRASALLES